MDFRLELVSVPTTDVDRAIRFYVDRVGFVLDHDHRLSETDRFVQLTPPGSACSICLGTGIAATRTGPLDGLQVVVDDVEEARRHLVDGGVDVSEVDHQPWGSFVHFRDPDGNGWAVQQLPAVEGEMDATIEAAASA
jgi:catechol 2,3-dioxygenase-like lactoylglutathione lyase family enzyme